VLDAAVPAPVAAPAHAQAPADLAPLSAVALQQMSIEALQQELARRQQALDASLETAAREAAIPVDSSPDGPLCGVRVLHQGTESETAQMLNDDHPEDGLCPGCHLPAGTNVRCVQSCGTGLNCHRWKPMPQHSSGYQAELTNECLGGENSLFEFSEIDIRTQDVQVISA
jgi:hypothetical protein